jgi:hypothetical protein
MDILLIAALIYTAIVFRKSEVEILIHVVGIFKDIEDMNDREMFVEYEKMRKQSVKVKK